MLFFLIFCLYALEHNEYHRENLCAGGASLFRWLILYRGWDVKFMFYCLY